MTKLTAIVGFSNITERDIQVKKFIDDIVLESHYGAATSVRRNYSRARGSLRTLKP